MRLLDPALTTRIAVSRARSPQFAASYQAIARQQGKKIATTAVARKLLTRAWHLLTDAELAVPQPATTPAPLGDVFEVTNKVFEGQIVPGDNHLALDGRVVEVLSEQWLGAQDPLADRQQRGVLVAGRGRRIPGPAGEAGAGGQGVGVLGTKHPLAGLEDLLLKHACRRVVAIVPQEAGHLCHGGAVGWVCDLHVGQQRSADGPGSRPLSVCG